MSVDDSNSLSDLLVIGISSSGPASNIVNALNLANEKGTKTCMISARKLQENFHNFNTVELDVDYYHSGEVLSLLLTYQLIHGSGFSCPSISQKLDEPSFDRLVNSKAIDSAI